MDDRDAIKMMMNRKDYIRKRINELITTYPEMNMTTIKKRAKWSWKKHLIYKICNKSASHFYITIVDNKRLFKGFLSSTSIKELEKEVNDRGLKTYGVVFRGTNSIYKNNFARLKEKKENERKQNIYKGLPLPVLKVIEHGK